MSFVGLVWDFHFCFAFFFNIGIQEREHEIHYPCASCFDAKINGWESRKGNSICSENFH